MSAEQRLRRGLHEAARRIDIEPSGPADVAQRARRRRVRHLAVASLAAIVVLGGVVLAATTMAGSGAPGVEVVGHPDGTRAVAVFLCDGRECDPISDEERDRLGAALKREPSVLEVTYESKTDAYNRFLERFADQPDFTAGVSAEDLPPSFRVMLDLSGDVEDFTDRYGAHAGVEDVIVMPDQHTPTPAGSGVPR